MGMKNEDIEIKKILIFIRKELIEYFHNKF